MSNEKLFYIVELAIKADPRKAIPYFFDREISKGSLTLTESIYEYAKLFPLEFINETVKRSREWNAQTVLR